MCSCSLTAVADRERAAVAVGAEQVADQVVAAARALAARRPADVEPVREPLALRFGQLAQHLLGALERRLAVQLEHQVAVRARVTSSGGPTGRQPCDTTTSTRSAPFSASATPPSCATQSFRISALPCGLRARARHAADHAHAGRVAVERPEHALDVERERIAEQHHQLGAATACGAWRANSIGSVAAAAQPAFMSTNGLDLDARQARGEHRERRAGLDLVLARDHAVRARAEQAPGRQARCAASRPRLRPRRRARR